MWHVSPRLTKIDKLSEYAAVFSELLAENQTGMKRRHFGHHDLAKHFIYR